MSLLRILALAVLSFPSIAAEPRLATLEVSGMACMLCAAKVKKSLLQVPGVVEAKVERATNTAEVRYDAEKVKAETLAKAVSDAGFQATVKR